MAVNIIYRLVKGTPLSFAEGDSNLGLLLKNLSGSNVTIESNITSITGSVEISGSNLTLHEQLKFASTNVVSSVTAGVPLGFLIIQIGGNPYKIPYFAMVGGGGS